MFDDRFHLCRRTSGFNLLNRILFSQVDFFSQWRRVEDEKVEVVGVSMLRTPRQHPYPDLESEAVYQVTDTLDSDSYLLFYFEF